MYEIFQLRPVNIRFSLERVREGVHWSRAFMMVNTVKYVVTHPPPQTPSQNKLDLNGCPRTTCRTRCLLIKLSDPYDVFLIDIVRDTRQSLWTMIYRSQ